MVTELVVVVEILVALGDAEDPLGDKAAQAVLDPLGISVIGEAGRQLVRERQEPIDPGQQQGAGIGSDGTAVEISHHAAASVEFKLQGFGVTLCRYRFSLSNLVNSLSKSKLPDSGNRCDLPLGEKCGLVALPYRAKERAQKVFSPWNGKATCQATGQIFGERRVLRETQRSLTPFDFSLPLLSWSAPPAQPSSLGKPTTP